MSESVIHSIREFYAAYPAAKEAYLAACQTLDSISLYFEKNRIIRRIRKSGQEAQLPGIANFAAKKAKLEKQVATSPCTRDVFQQFVEFLNDDDIRKALNPLLRRRLRRHVKALVEAHNWRIDPALKGYVLVEAPVGYLRNQKREFRANLRMVGHVLGLAMVVSCAITLGVAVHLVLGLLPSLIAAVFIFVANFYLFWNSTPEALILIFAKDLEKGLFRGLGNSFTDTIRKGLILLSVFFSTAAGLSLGGLCCISAVILFGFTASLVVGMPWAFGIIVGVATLFGITAMIMRAMVFLILTPWRDVKFALRRLFGVRPGEGLKTKGEITRHVLTVSFVVLWILIALACAALAATATLGVMHHAMIVVLTNFLVGTSIPAPVALQFIQVFSLIVVYGLNAVPRFAFNVISAVRYFGDLARRVIDRIFHPVNGLVHFAKFMDYTFDSWGALGKQLYQWFVDLSVAINAFSNGALIREVPGTVLLAGVLNTILEFFHLPLTTLDVDAEMAGIGGGAVSFAVNKLAADESQIAKAATSSDVLEVYYDDPVHAGLVNYKLEKAQRSATVEDENTDSVSSESYSVHSAPD